MSDHKYCRAVQKEILDSRFIDAEEFEGDLGLVFAAYEKGNGCVNDAVFYTEELEQEIILKFKYVLRALLTAVGENYNDYALIVEPSYEGDTSYVVMRASDNKVMLNGNVKAWAFGGDSLDELEEMLDDLAETIKANL